MSPLWGKTKKGKKKKKKSGGGGYYPFGAPNPDYKIFVFPLFFINERGKNPPKGKYAPGVPGGRKKN